MHIMLKNIIIVCYTNIFFLKLFDHFCRNGLKRTVLFFKDARHKWGKLRISSRADMHTFLFVGNRETCNVCTKKEILTSDFLDSKEKWTSNINRLLMLHLDWRKRIPILRLEMVVHMSKNVFRIHPMICL